MMVQQQHNVNQVLDFYESNYDHLVDELKKLDLMIQLRAIESRGHIAMTRGVAADPHVSISHEEIDRLLNRDGIFEPDAAESTEARRQIEAIQSRIDDKVRTSVDRGIFLALPALAHLFSLSPFDLQAMIICLAPELNRKYDRLYAYLQDDITRKRPSPDLILDLLCRGEADRWNARTLFSDQGPLFLSGILNTVDDPQSPSGSSGLAQFLKLDQRFLGYILGNNRIDGRLRGFVKLLTPAVATDWSLIDPAIQDKALNLIQSHLSAQSSDPKNLALYFRGSYGAGSRELALGICERLRCPLLYLDTELLLAHESDSETILRLALREGLLFQSAIYFDNADVLFKEDDGSHAILKKIADLIVEYGWLTFLSGEKPWRIKGLFEDVVFQVIELPVPDVPLREAAWQQALETLIPGAGREWTQQLASQFRLTPGQIQDASKAAHNKRSMDSRQEITLADLYEASRQQSNQKLGELAVKTETHCSWEDIVLLEDKVAQLKEICVQVRRQYRVFGEWGFDRKLARGKGVSALFSGPPGTGKTMAAEVIAHELQLDLYKVDLSGVVSKYIGETEKNLARIFDEAESSNAILFFDEADALFGKRTQVSDAHDRYANIETSYLLQKMEEHGGVVILATNLRENMDEAFTRRIRFIIEFPFPDATSRLEIWKTHFPDTAPVSDEIDYEFLSREFAIAGGNIKNIVLNAAFYAAEDGDVIGMEQILRSARREFEKMGKTWNEPGLIGSKRRD